MRGVKSFYDQRRYRIWGFGGFLVFSSHLCLKMSVKNPPETKVFYVNISTKVETLYGVSNTKKLSVPGGTI